MESIMSGNGSHVVACIPYYRCQRYVRRAVESLLAQTHRDLTVVVVNDADFETPPWPALADITDPRLIRFDLTENRGPYFALSATLAAVDAPYFLMQDSDDWSHPDRVARLLTALVAEQADFAVSAQPQVQENDDGTNKITSVRWKRVRCPGETFRPATFIFDPFLTPEFRYRIPHAGLFRTTILKAVGGYYGGFRTTYDVLLMNLILMTGRVAHIPGELYYRVVRPDSLTHSAATGVSSADASRAWQHLQLQYHNCFALYSDFLTGGVSAVRLTDSIRNICSSNVTAGERRLILREAARLERDLCRIASEYGNNGIS